jgi:dTDP-glucose 4,6-dehydratase
MKYIITGGCGFIGSNFIRFIKRESNNHARVVNIDKMTYAASPNTKLELDEYPHYEFVQEDICNRAAMESLIEQDDVVVNFAAESHVDRSIDDQNPFIQTNVIGVSSLLEASRKKKAQLFVQISTDEVYGSLDIRDPSSVETHMLCPSSPYSASKAAAEMLCFAAMRTFDQPIIITRSSNNFGPYQYPEKIIPLFVSRLLKGKTVPVYGNGENVRDWIFVERNCDAIDFIIECGEVGEVYNIGGGNEMSNLELTREIINYMDQDESSIEFVTDRLGHDIRYSLSCSKLKRLGWEADGDFIDDLGKTIEWYKEHMDWWNGEKA